MANKLIEDTKVQIEMLLSGKYTFSPFDTAEILQKLVDALQKCEQANVSGSLPHVTEDDLRGWAERLAFDEQRLNANIYVRDEILEKLGGNDR